jgi:hypothetical protein
MTALLLVLLLPLIGWRLRNPPSVKRLFIVHLPKRERERPKPARPVRRQRDGR